MANYKLSFTGDEIDSLLSKIKDLDKIIVPNFDDEQLKLNIHLRSRYNSGFKTLNVPLYAYYDSSRNFTWLMTDVGVSVENLQVVYESYFDGYTYFSDYVEFNSNVEFYAITSFYGTTNYHDDVTFDAMTYFEDEATFNGVAYFNHSIVNEGDLEVGGDTYLQDVYYFKWDAWAEFLTLYEFRPYNNTEMHTQKIVERIVLHDDHIQDLSDVELQKVISVYDRYNDYEFDAMFLSYSADGNVATMSLMQDALSISLRDSIVFRPYLDADSVSASLNFISILLPRPSYYINGSVGKFIKFSPGTNRYINITQTLAYSYISDYPFNSEAVIGTITKNVFDNLQNIGFSQGIFIGNTTSAQNGDFVFNSGHGSIHPPMFATVPSIGVTSAGMWLPDTGLVAPHNKLLGTDCRYYTNGMIHFEDWFEYYDSSIGGGGKTNYYYRIKAAINQDAHDGDPNIYSHGAFMTFLQRATMSGFLLTIPEQDESQFTLFRVTSVALGDEYNAQYTDPSGNSRTITAQGKISIICEGEDGILGKKYWIELWYSVDDEMYITLMEK